MGKIISIIPARGGSKRFPGKNLHPLMGKPLIAYPIEAALKADLVDRVIVSTDDDQIAETAKKLGAEVPFLRPENLASDKSLVVSALQHTVTALQELENYHVDYTVLLQPTTPIITPDQIDEAVTLALSKNANSVVAVSRVDTVNHPYNIRELLSDGTTKFWKENFHYECAADERPVFFHAANLWLSSRETLMNENRLESSSKNYPMTVPSVNAMDIDHYEDLQKVEAMLQYMKHNK